MAEIVVVSLRRGATPAPDGYRVERVDRGTPLGNPFRMYSESDRDLVCARYEAYLARKIQNPASPVTRELRRLFNLYCRGHDLALACWCAPKRCHAESVCQALLDWERERGARAQGRPREK